MKKILKPVLLMAIIATGPVVYGQDFYYSGDSAYQFTRSDARIAIQFDTTGSLLSGEAFIGTHACLNASVPVEYVGRGFSLFGLQPGYGYAASAESLLDDPTVHRAIPVYHAAGESVDLPVTDMVSVRFEPELPIYSALTLLTTYGLRFVDSSEFRHNLWYCALNDTIRESPLEYGNQLHFAPGVLWACAALFVRDAPTSGPADPYYQYQYYLKGENGGTPGIDINVEQAWQIPLTYPALRVAILDDGLAPHTELSWPRLLRGYDFVGENADVPWQDTIATPGPLRNHGMACAGILAASHNGVGVAGVCGTCEVLPVKKYDDLGNASADPRVNVNAIYYAAASGARVVSNSWGYPMTSPVQEVADAIRDVTNKSCTPIFGDTLGLVMIFAAGNAANVDSGTVRFPANMPEVISVGSTTKTGAHWKWSCYRPDVVAPSGSGAPASIPIGDQWTIDQMANLGWNPYVTGFSDANGDRDYTARMNATSGACPQVAGIAALLMARGHADIPNCNPGPKIREIITRTATDMGTAGWDQYYGYGLANAYRALLSIIRGDVDNNGVIDIFDIMMVSDIAFSGGSAVLDNRTADVNCDSVADVFDVIHLILYVLSGGPPPVICYDY